jgi:transposase
LVDWGVESGQIDEQQLRLTIEARREKARELVDSGLSQRQAAKVLGVDQKTI